MTTARELADEIERRFIAASNEPNDEKMRHDVALLLGENVERIVAALRSSVQEEPAARAVALVADDIEKWIGEQPRPDEWILQEWVRKLRASTLPQSAQSKELRDTAKAAVDAYLNDKRTDAEKVADGVKFIMGPRGDEGTRQCFCNQYPHTAECAAPEKRKA